jgi:hypothetical protein
MFGEFENEIIKGAAEVVTNLADQNSDTQGHKCFGEVASADVVRRILVELDGNGIFLLPANDLNPLPQISKVFVCPPYSFERAIEGIHGGPPWLR